jgi:hypothetical protein
MVGALNDFKITIFRASLRPTEVPNMYNFLLSGRDINHAELVAHPEALIPLFVEYTGGRKDIAFKDIVW